MTDVQEAATPTILYIPVSKGRSGELELNLDDVKSNPHYLHALKLGFKAMTNSGMTNIKESNYKTKAEYQAAVMAKAEANLKAICDGTFSIRGTKAKSDKTSPEVKKLAMDMARTIIRAEAKRKGFKVSLIKSSVITAKAKVYLEATPSLIQKAKDQLEAQEREAASAGGIDLGDMAEDDELRAKAAQAKAAKQLSAAKAGNIAGRGRPGVRH